MSLLKIKPVRTKNLGEALSILIRERRELDEFHADISAWGAPSECHSDVNDDAYIQDAIIAAEGIASHVPNDYIQLYDVKIKDLLNEAKNRTTDKFMYTLNY